VARFSSNTINQSVNFVANTVVMGLLSGNNEMADLEEIAILSLWCQDNSLMLNLSKTKKLIVDLRRTLQHQRTYTPLGINGTAVERVSSFRYLGVHIAEDIDTGEKGEATPLPPQAAEEVLSLPEDPSDLLRWCGGEHPDREHHCLVQQQLLSGQEGSAEGSAFC